MENNHYCSRDNYNVRHALWIMICLCLRSVLTCLLRAHNDCCCCPHSYIEQTSNAFHGSTNRSQALYVDRTAPIIYYTHLQVTIAQYAQCPNTITQCLSDGWIVNMSCVCECMESMSSAKISRAEIFAMCGVLYSILIMVRHSMQTSKQFVLFPKTLCGVNYVT